jgi:hypothetical protein
MSALRWVPVCQGVPDGGILMSRAPVDRLATAPAGAPAPLTRPQHEHTVPGVRSRRGVRRPPMHWQWTPCTHSVNPRGRSRLTVTPEEQGMMLVHGSAWHTTVTLSVTETCAKSCRRWWPVDLFWSGRRTGSVRLREDRTRWLGLSRNSVNRRFSHFSSPVTSLCGPGKPMSGTTPGTPLPCVCVRVYESVCVRVRVEASHARARLH